MAIVPLKVFVRQYHHRITIVLLLGMLLLEGGCTQDNLDSEVLRAAKILQSKTVPSEAKNLSISNPIRSSSSVTITWEFEVNWQMNDYYQWSKKQLQSILNFSKQEDFSQEWRQTLSGDIYNLKINTTHAESPIQVQVTFISSVF